MSEPGSASTGRPRRGRRPAGSDARAEIVAAARGEFAEKGYDATSLRGIARAAGVDAALVHHYFDGKEALLGAVLDVPTEPLHVAERVAGPGMAGAGERVLASFLGVWDAPDRRPVVVAVLRAVLGSPQTAGVVRGVLTGPLLGEVARRVGSPAPERAAALLASQLMGLAVVRYAARLEPVASATPEELARWYGPVLQRYLEGGDG